MGLFSGTLAPALVPLVKGLFLFPFSLAESIVNMKQEKRFIIRKYVMADSAEQALKRERAVKADDIWVDEEWMKQNLNLQGKVIRGFVNKG